MNALSAELDSTLRELRINIEKTGRYNPAVQKSLLAAYGGIANSAQQISGLVASDILAGHFATPPGVFLDMATAEIDNSYTQMHQVLLPTTKTLIEARIARAKNTLLVTVSSALLMLLVVIYLSVSIYYAIIGSIRSLVRSAHTFAEGDLSVRVKLDTRDELSRIGDSFNRMADGFNALLEERTRAVHALYESEKLYHSLFENMLNGLAYCQMLFEQGQPQDFVYLNVNAAFEVQTGLKNVVGKKVSEVIPGIRQSDPELFEVYGRVALSGKPERLEIYLTAMQQWFWLSVYSPKEGYFVAVFDVITERKQAEDALRKSKDLLQSVIENAPVQIFWKDRDSRYLGCNTSFAKGAGYSAPDEVAGKTDFEMAWKDYAGSYRADDKAVMESGNARLNYEEPFTTPDGNLAWAHTSKVPLRDESNQVVGILGIYEDITERKNTEAALRESEDRFRKVFEEGGLGMAMADLTEGRFVRANRAFCEMLGYTEDELKQLTAADITHPDHRAQDVETVRSLREGQIQKHTTEKRYLKKNGEAIWGTRTLTRIQSADGKSFYALAMIADISERKLAEGALRKSKDLIQSVVDNTPVHIFWKDRDSRYLGCNTQFAKAAGYSRPDELIGKTDFDVWRKDLAELYRADDKAVMDSGNARLNYEELGTASDGNMIWVRTSKVPLRDESNQIIGILGIFEDITARKQGEAALKESERVKSELLEKLKEAQHLAIIGSWEWDLQTNHVWWSDETYQIFGVTPQNYVPGFEANGKFIHPDDFEKYNKSFEHSLQTGEPLDIGIRLIANDGLLKHCHAKGKIIYGDSGQQVRFIGTIMDITERKRAEQELIKFQQQAQHYLDIAGVMLIALDRQGRVQMVNRKGCEILGYSEADILGKNWFDNYLPSLERKRVGEIFARLMGGDIASVEYHENEILTRSGDVLTIAWHNSLLLDESGNISGTLSSGEDITERKQAEQELLEGRKRLHAIIETALDAVVQMDDEGIITGWNAQAEKIFGWLRDEAIGRMMSETIVPQQYREAHKQGLKRFLATGEGAILNSQVEMLGMHRDGHEFPIELAVVPIKAGDQYEFSGFIRDITERKKAEDMIWRQANFDMLTGLPNRHMFFDRLTQEIRKSERTRLPLALLYIDLDHFKEINDTLGHSMGDKLLVETAQRIGACVREADTVARLGGDEFIIILTDLQETGRIDALSQNILRKLAEPFRLESEVAYLSASLGITLYPHDAAGMEELIKNADQAMYAAKNAGRNRFNYFTQSMQQTAQARMRLVNDLRGALAAGQLRLYFQPIVELATGRIHKAEALIRWQHPLRGMVSPAEFIPLAEETGLILEIGDWVFREAVREAKRWRASYDPEFQVSVNMSPVQFHGESSLCRQWPAHLREAGLPGQSLVIEITEGVLLEKEPVVMDKLLRFRDANIQISLDDFGTGYSSLSYLQKFDIDYLKIDQSFTCKLEAGSSSMALSEAIIVMAHRLGMKVIAEGVETEAQHTLLAAAGCDYGQGYLFSRPVPAEEFEELLKGGSTRDSQAE